MMAGSVFFSFGGSAGIVIAVYMHCLMTWLTMDVHHRIFFLIKGAVKNSIFLFTLYTFFVNE